MHTQCARSDNAAAPFLKTFHAHLHTSMGVLFECPREKLYYYPKTTHTHTHAAVSSGRNSLLKNSLFSEEKKTTKTREREECNSEIWHRGRSVAAALAVMAPS